MGDSVLVMSGSATYELRMVGLTWQRSEQNYLPFHGISLHFRLCRRHALGARWRNDCRLDFSETARFGHDAVQSRAANWTGAHEMPLDSM